MQFEFTLDKSLMKFADDMVDNIGPVASLSLLESAERVKSSTRRVVLDRFQKTAPTTGRLSSLGAGGWEKGPIETESNSLFVDVTSPVKYAKIHHYGGTIKPRPPRKNLAIPNRSFHGRNPLMPREYDPSRKLLKWVPSKSGKTTGHLIDINTNKHAYYLVKQTRIRPTYYMEDAVALAIPDIIESMDDLLNALVEDSAGDK